MKNNQEDFYPAALTISASDPGGNAGIQADLRTFNAAGVYGCSVITAITVQTPQQVTEFAAVEPALVKAQLEGVLSSVAIKAVKIGMLANERIIKTVTDILRCHKLPLIIEQAAFQPDKNILETVQKELLPLASLIILDIPGAESLLNSKLKNEKDYTDAAMQLADKYKCNILLENGHISGGKVCNIAVLAKKLYTLASPDIADLEYYTLRGIDSTLSSGITAMLAAGNSWRDSLTAAQAHVFGALNETAHIGKGLDAMYPPLEDYSRQITLRSLEKSTKSKGSNNAS